MEISISPTKIRKILILIFLGLLAFNFLYILVEYGLDNEVENILGKGSLSDYLEFFYFESERSFPTAFSGFQLFISSMLLYFISKKKNFKKLNGLQWKGLSFIFLFMTFDELISIHEPLVSITHGFIDITSEYLTFAWVIPYGIGCVVFVLLYLNFLKNLPSKTRTLFITSGVVFCSGALGLELIGGKIFSQVGEYTWQFALITTAEESLEMLGICLFIFALTDYISTNIDSSKEVLIKKSKNHAPSEDGILLKADKPS